MVGVDGSARFDAAFRRISAGQAPSVKGQPLTVYIGDTTPEGVVSPI